MRIDLMRLNSRVEKINNVNTRQDKTRQNEITTPAKKRQNKTGRENTKLHKTHQDMSR